MTDYASYLKTDRLAIFLFHGVIDKQVHSVRNYIRKHLERDYFADVLRSLKAHGRAVTLRDVADAHEAGERLPPNSFAVTFDDGFENNWTVAAPVLADFSIPSTFFITTEFVDANLMPWPDRLEHAFETAKPGTVRVPWGEAEFSDTPSRRALIDKMRKYIKTTRGVDGQAFATDIQRQLGGPEVRSLPGPLDQKMTWKQVRDMNDEPLFDVGGHSHTHPIMSFLAEEDLDREINVSLSLLKDKAGVAPDLYSYPEGLTYCYSDLVIDHLKRAGVRVCPSAETGDNDETTDLFELKRINVV